MSVISRIMIGLDLSEMDETVIQYAREFVNTMSGVEVVYFVHVVKSLELPEEIRKKYGDLLLPNDEAIKHGMQSEVEKHFGATEKLEVVYEVLEGEPLKQLLHWSRVKLVELIIAGKKKKENGTGITMEKLARKSPCSILFVTESRAAAPKKFLIPIDFSKRTDYVFEMARSLKSNIPDAVFVCQNVVDVPVGYYKIGKSFEEFAEIMKENAMKKWEQYGSTHDLSDLSVEVHFSINHKDNIAKIIFNYAKEADVDIIIMGSKGQTDAAAFLLGSVAEKLISYDYDIPLFLVKRQGEIYDFFDALDRV